ncbi:MAG: DJ-1/PfpI family protein [Bryobacteraceae bacterium]
MSRKILIVTGDGGNGYEALYAYQRFDEARWVPMVAAPVRRRLHMVSHDEEVGWETYVEGPAPSIDADVVITAVAAREFAAVLILGGRAPEYLRNDASLISLVHEFAAQNKGIFAIGHGVQVLAAAGILKGRTLTAHPHVRVEVERSGGTYLPKPAVRDGNLVTGQTWRAHAEFYRLVFECLE